MNEEDFSCSICLDILIEPLIIQCGHSFCRLCIEDSLNICEWCPICRCPPGRPVINRQMESVTIRWMQDTGRGSEYIRRKELNRERISLRNRALVIIWTSLTEKIDHAIKLEEIINNEIIDKKLREEIIRQVSLQTNIGLKVEQQETGGTIIRLVRNDE